MRRSIAAALLLLAPSPALAAPPPGWEEAPAPPPPPSVGRARWLCGNGAAAEQCRQRVLELDEARPNLRLESSIDVPLAKLVRLSARKGTRGGPTLTEAPTLVLRDGDGRRAPFRAKPSGATLALPFGRGRIANQRTSCGSSPGCRYSFIQLGLLEERHLHPLSYSILDVAPNWTRVVLDEVEADITLTAKSEAELVHPQVWHHLELAPLVPELPVFAGVAPDGAGEELVLVLPDGFVLQTSMDARLDVLGFEWSWGDAPRYERVGLPITKSDGRFVRFVTTGSAKLGKTEDQRARVVHVEHAPPTDGGEPLLRVRVLRAVR